MKITRTIFRAAAGAICGVGLFVSQAAATPMARPTVEDPIVLVGGDCYSIGQQVAAQNGGTLAKASQGTQGGRPVCRIVVLVPGKDGQRPRRTEIVVPKN
jgi:hypothetical protein